MVHARDMCSVISIHALREEGDLDCLGHARAVRLISIHALREEGDWGTLPWSSRPPDFYPRPP